MITVILIGKSSVGKDTLLNYMVQQGYKKVVSHTSRPKREYETDGWDYHFVSKDEFIKMQDTGNFIQTRTYDTVQNGNFDTWYYGLYKNEISFSQNNVVIFDVQGAKDFIDITDTNVLVVNLMLDDEDRKERAKARGSFCEIEWNRRLADDEIRFSKEELYGVSPINVYTKGMDIEEVYECILPFIEHLQND
jgi:guanylate kinase